MKSHGDEVERGLRVSGVAMLVIATLGVMAGVLTGNFGFYAFALFVGFWGFLYLAVTGALRERDR